MFFLAFKTSSLIHGLFTSVLFNFQVLNIFPLSFCYWYKFDSIMFRERALYISITLNFLRFLKAPRYHYLGVCSLCTWKECIFCSVSWVICRCWLELLGGIAEFLILSEQFYLQIFLDILSCSYKNLWRNEINKTQLIFLIYAVFSTFKYSICIQPPQF